ncbi:Hsp70 family protein, partial [Leptospira interrogans]|uniref:Hsp70 family protein n=1 Tax=Leptospira interrogans TaxID=173 RepID=UPI00187F884D
MSKEKIIGIELGTTNSVVSVIEGGEPGVIQNSKGASTTPSIVAFTAKGETIIGQFGKKQAITNAVNTMRSAKRFIGRRLKECASEKKHDSYKAIRCGNEG